MVDNYKTIVVSGLLGSGKTALTGILASECGMIKHSAGDEFRKEYAQNYPNKEITFDEFWRRTRTEDARKLNAHPKSMLESKGMVGDPRHISYLDNKTCLLVLSQPT